MGSTKSPVGFLLALLPAAIVLIGCASSRPTTADTEAFASRLIADKVAVAAEAQREYAALVSENEAMLGQRQAALSTDEIDVDYIGKPQEFLQTFAHRYGYSYVESGRRRKLRTINIRMQHARPVDVLRNVHDQMRNAAVVSLEADSRTLRLIYKNANG